MRRLHSHRLVLACAIGALTAGPAAARPPTVAPLGTVSSTVETRSVVARLDPVTLAPTGPRVELGEYHDGWAFSPDGRRIAFGKSPAGSNTRDAIRIVDAASVELVGTVLTPAYVGPLAWLAGDRLVGLVADARPVVVDPRVPRILRSSSPPAGSCVGPPSAASRRVLVTLSGRALATVDARGRVRRVAVPIVPSQCFRAALVVDAPGERAWVLAGRRGVVRVDLESMRAVALSLRGTGISGGARVDATMVGRRHIAVAHRTARESGRGVEVLDLRARRRRTIDRRAGAVAVARGTVLTFAGRSASSRTTGARIGVRGYTPGGRRRFAVLRGARVFNVQVAGRYAYAIGTNGVSAIDVRSGRVVSTARGLANAEVELLEPPRR